MIAGKIEITFDADEFIDIDFEISTNNKTILTDEEIVESIVNDTDGKSVEEEDENDEVNDVPPQKPTLSERMPWS